MEGPLKLKEHSKTLSFRMGIAGFYSGGGESQFFGGGQRENLLANLHLKRFQINFNDP
jgi:hypothetical protein